LKKWLYFIALLLPEDISDQITLFKREMADKYNAKHALKSPPHITLQMPFRRSEHQEANLIEKLTLFAGEKTGFDIHLSGFGSFAPRVIFVDVIHSQPIYQKHDELKSFLQEKLEFSLSDLTFRFSPHVTIATRDLKKEIFPQAWNAFRERDYDARFKSKDLALLKHNGSKWKIHKRFSWKK